MPARSKAQYNLMQSIAHGRPKRKGIGGISRKTAKKFIRTTPKKKRSMFARGRDY
jgi:hypothetical protein